MTAGNPERHAIPARMRAVVVRAPLQYAVEDVPTPEVPAGGLLLRVLACALCGSDLRTLRGGHRKARFPLDDFAHGAALALDGSIVKAVFLP
jgi:threonine dehydrogenase-like Zn-dependent dehydrogenase